jgi:hypothetical protein
MGAGLVRCSLFVDTDGLSNGGAGDASTFDSSSSDAPFSSDATLDGGNSSDAPIAFDAQFPGCGATHVLCDDFETNAFTDRWNDSNINNGGIVEYVADASVSPTHAMHCSIPASVGGAAASLDQDLFTKMTSMHCQLDVLIRPSSPNPWEAILLDFAGDDAGAANYYTTVNVGKTETQLFCTTQLTDGGGVYDEQTLPAIPAGSWTSLALDIQPSGGTEMVTLTIGGGSPVTRPFGAPPGATLTRIEVNPGYSQAPVDMLVDNVLCDVVP